MDGLDEFLAVWRLHDELVAAGYRPTPQQIAPGDWVWWRSEREGVERPVGRTVVADSERGWYVVAYRGRHCEWQWAWIPYGAVTGHVPVRLVRAERVREEAEPVTVDPVVPLKPARRPRRGAEKPKRK